MSGRISFIGAGPGAADLITVRGARRIAEADVVLWTASLVSPECIKEHARADVELVDSSRLGHDDAIEVYRRAERDKLKVARVHAGDPSLWGAVQDQHDACARMQLEVEIVPGVATFSAAAASAGQELTVPEVAQSVVLTQLEGGQTPMPDGEKVREFARHGTTMALLLSAARTSQLVEELRAGGYADDVPVLVAYKVSWPDELVLRTTLGELQATVKQHKLWRHTLFVVGRALQQRGGPRSRLYGSGHGRTSRHPDSAARPDSGARKDLRPEQDGSGQTGSARRSRLAGRSRSGAVGAGSGVPDGSAGPAGSAAPAGEALWGMPEPRTEPDRSGRSNSDVAWWAVRDWQRSARESARFVTRSTRHGPGSAQPDLFVETDEDEDASPEVGESEGTSEVRNFSLVPAGSDVPAGSEGPAAGEFGAESRPDADPAASEVDVPAAEAKLSVVPDPVVDAQADDETTSASRPEDGEPPAGDSQAGDPQTGPRENAELPGAADTEAASTQTASTQPASAETADSKSAGSAKRAQGKTAQDKQAQDKQAQGKTPRGKTGQTSSTKQASKTGQTSTTSQTGKTRQDGKAGQAGETGQAKPSQSRAGRSKSTRGKASTARTGAESGPDAETSTTDDHSG